MNSKKTYYAGNLRHDSLTDMDLYYGWVVGVFMKDPQRNTDQVEVKYWEYKKGEKVKDYLKTSATTEWTYIIKGKIKARVDDTEVTLSAGDYILIHPNTPNNTVAEILEDVQAITVKAPSDQKAKKILAATKHS